MYNWKELVRIPVAGPSRSNESIVSSGAHRESLIIMDKALKQRLVGASVIIALAVIILPMLLSGRPQATSQQSQKIELPPRPDELSFETRRFPVSEAQGTAQQVEEPPQPAFGRRQQGATSVDQDVPVKELAEPEPDAEEQVALPEQESPKPDTVVDNKTAETSKPTVEPTTGQEEPAPAPRAISPTPAPASSSGRYVVQVASLGSSENASRLMKSLKEKGYPVLMDVIDSDVGRLNRVRVGPYAQESEASRASIAIGNAFSGVSPRILDLQPDQSAPSTASSDPLVRWVVQAGSFSEVSNADRLVSQLKSENMSAYREAVTSSSSTIYRVRVGPFLERDEAIKTKQALSSSMGIDGVVMSAD